MKAEVAERLARVIDQCPAGRLGDLFAFALLNPFEEFTSADARDCIRALPDEDLVRRLEVSLRRLKVASP